MYNLLTPGCSDCKKKVLFFAASEKWIPLDTVGQEGEVLQKCFSHIKTKYRDFYYHTLFHLLTCHFCLEQEYELLEPRSHPDLWKIALKPEENFWETLRSTKDQKDEKSYYFRTLYEQLVLSLQKGIVLCVFSKDKAEEKVLPLSRAAGISDKIPSDILLSDFSLFKEEEISLHWERDSVDNSLCIALQGGSARIRSAILLKVYYSDGSCEIYQGEELRMGGMWRIEMQKAEKLCRIELLTKESSK
ncbi:MAG: hypothetical protein HUU50_08150 [Candidatus Brocadiae bacterium]|nr:hypothetical protein [Candidatus Brocadiia bacterium]